MSYNFSNLKKGLYNINGKLPSFLLCLCNLLIHNIQNSEFKYENMFNE